MKDWFSCKLDWLKVTSSSNFTDCKPGKEAHLISMISAKKAEIDEIQSKLEVYEHDLINVQTKRKIKEDEESNHGQLQTLAELCVLDVEISCLVERETKRMKRYAAQEAEFWSTAPDCVQLTKLKSEEASLAAQVELVRTEVQQLSATDLHQQHDAAILQRNDAHTTLSALQQLHERERELHQERVRAYEQHQAMHAEDRRSLMLECFRAHNEAQNLQLYISECELACNELQTELQ
eukprot:TRINITY_DN1990_c0_g1_i2.p2 TRINITY_DN1990_c0_g1~~TRINITY_DN1990_c0_g1_i2.p2  ORF type:complete len:236 (+),score=54.15 TRINITY_DN1990_c0_g1_i2:1502-2209(+)